MPNTPLSLWLKRCDWWAFSSFALGVFAYATPSDTAGTFAMVLAVLVVGRGNIKPEIENVRRAWRGDVSTRVCPVCNGHGTVVVNPEGMIDA